MSEDHDTKPMPRYLSVKQVREWLGGAVSIRLIYKLIDQGKLRVNRALGKVLVLGSSLEALLASGEVDLPGQKQHPNKRLPRRLMPLPDRKRPKAE